MTVVVANYITQRIRNQSLFQNFCLKSGIINKLYMVLK